ncbi:hypothetical protein HY256_07790 [Candidatus Sumerlaeota bacterium]|nr:hypothetical protein [Candidatus Sumerlaeota bacterium]
MKQPTAKPEVISRPPAVISLLPTPALPSSPTPSTPVNVRTATTSTSKVSSIPPEDYPFIPLPPEKTPKDYVDWFKRVQLVRPAVVAYEVYTCSLGKLLKGKNPRDLKAGDALIMNLTDKDAVELVIKDTLMHASGGLSIWAEGTNNSDDWAHLVYELATNTVIGEIRINGKYREVSFDEPFAMFVTIDSSKNPQPPRKKRTPTTAPTPPAAEIRKQSQH